ncbi:MAG TPA: GAF domain-containing protein [Candidatus Altiarchaeales archaeon]|nr:GAF domain-containing protein [Candidatus Altiarchaeales archaeon]
MSLFVLITTYAIVRHQLLDIEIIIKKTLVFAGLFAAVFAMLVLPTLIIQEYIFGGRGIGGRIAGLILSGLIIILTVRRIENLLINATDKYLFQKRYDYKELLKTFTNEVLTVLDLKELVKLTVDKLSDIIKLQSCGILLLDESKNEYHLAASYGIKERDIVLTMDNTLASFLARTKMYLSVKEHERKDYHMPGKIVEDMNKLKLELAIPLITLQGKMIGILTLGKKKSDEDYTQEDIDILLSLARTLAIAISNARMVGEISRLYNEAMRRERIATVGTLAAGMAHEIKNPLTSIKTFVEYVDTKYTHSEFREKFNSIVPREIERIRDIVDQLLDYSNVGKTHFRLCNIHRILDYALDLYSNEFIRRGIKLKRIYNSYYPYILAEENQLKQVFINIILNSIEAMSIPGNNILTIRTMDNPINNTIETEIRDTGCGISKERIKNIFDPFYTTKDKGTGLGLFIVHQIIENNKGKIAIESEEGRGTAVKIIFSKTNK